ncbi:MAG: NAD(P)H-dependent oxidoreductase [Rickettsiales bacterium]
MRILAFAASYRSDSLNKKLVALLAKEAKRIGTKIEIADYDDFDMPLYRNDHTEITPKSANYFLKKVGDSNGIIISMPEYNRSIPSSLKNVIDWTSKIDRTAFTGKTFFLTSASAGIYGGITGLNQLKTPLEALGAIVFNQTFTTIGTENAFDGSGDLVDKQQQDMLFSMIKDYISFTEKLSVK